MYFKARKVQIGFFVADYMQITTVKIFFKSVYDYPKIQNSENLVKFGSFLPLGKIFPEEYCYRRSGLSVCPSYLLLQEKWNRSGMCLG